MNISNLALRLEQIDADEHQPRESARHSLRVIIATAPAAARRARRRLSLDARSIQIRDNGLRQFRVF